jgi:hypothetical protein
MYKCCNNDSIRQANPTTTHVGKIPDLSYDLVHKYFGRETSPSFPHHHNPNWRINCPVIMLLDMNILIGVTDEAVAKIDSLVASAKAERSRLAVLLGKMPGLDKKYSSRTAFVRMAIIEALEREAVAGNRIDSNG